MTRRITFFSVALGLAALAVAGEAQEPRTHSVVAVLAHAVRPDDPAVDIFRQEMQRLGYVEGRDLSIEFRTARGRVDRLSGLAAELVGPKADVIVVGSTEAARAVKRASSTMAIVPDPVASGLVTGLARPGGSITGIASRTWCGDRLRTWTGS